MNHCEIAVAIGIEGQLPCMVDADFDSDFYPDSNPPLSLLTTAFRQNFSENFFIFRPDRFILRAKPNARE